MAAARRRARRCPVPVRSTPAAICAGTDQRGLARPVNTTCDIGAVESRGFTLTSPVPTTEIGQPGTAFATAPVVAVAPASSSDPVDGGVVTFAILPGAGGVSGIFGTVTGCTVT